MSEFILPVRVYYENTDSGGVVYHSDYLNFMERARTEWLRSLALEQDEIISRYDVIFAVRSVSIDYLKPAVFNDALLVTSRLEKLGKASINFHQAILRESDQTLLTRAKVRVASLGASSKKPVAIPEKLYKQFLAFV